MLFIVKECYSQSKHIASQQMLSAIVILMMSMTERQRQTWSLSSMRWYIMPHTRSFHPSCYIQHHHHGGESILACQPQLINLPCHFPSRYCAFCCILLNFIPHFTELSLSMFFYRPAAKFLSSKPPPLKTTIIIIYHSPENVLNAKHACSLSWTQAHSACISRKTKKYKR